MGVDVGGTFTDVVLANADGDFHVDKVPTTPDDPRVGVIEGVRHVLSGASVAPGDVSRVVHGTTLATNVILEQKGSPLAFVVTEGFADLLRLGREARVEDDRYDLFFTTPAPPVDPQPHVRSPRADHGRRQRAARAVRRGRRRRRPAGRRGVDVGRRDLPAQRLREPRARARHRARAAAPRSRTRSSSTSTEVWPEMREYERAMTTVMCAYVGPGDGRVPRGPRSAARRAGHRAARSRSWTRAGGVMSAALAARRPVRTLESGGAAGVTAAGLVGRLIGAAT